MVRCSRAAWTAGLTLLLIDCDRPPSDPDLIAVQKAARQGDASECPWLDGHYEWIVGNPASRVFHQDPEATRSTPFLELKKNPTSDTYPWRMTQRESVFDASAERLRRMDPARFSEWRQKMQLWREQRENEQNVDVVMREIEELGPVSERRGVLSAKECDEGWVLVHYGDEQRMADDFEADSSRRYETGIWLGKNAKGDLLYRVDRYRMRHSAIGSFDIRTTRTRAYGKAAIGVASAESSWQPKEEWFAEPSVKSRDGASPVDWTNVLVDLSRSILAGWPEGSEMTRFEPRPDSSDPSHAVELEVMVGGRARSNAQVHEIVSMLQAQSAVASVELTTVGANGSGKFEFETRLTLRP